MTSRHSYLDKFTGREVTVVAHWVYDTGAETGDQSHPMNGHGKGWRLDEITTENEFGVDDTEIFSESEIEDMYEHVLRTFDPSILNG